MHLKNLALLKIGHSGVRAFATLRFAPFYDAVAPWVFPDLARDRIALELNGKDDRLTREDFLSLARTIDLPVQRAREILREIDTGLSQALNGGLSLLGVMSAREAAVFGEVATLVAARLETLRRLDGLIRR